VGVIEILEKFLGLCDQNSEDAEDDEEDMESVEDFEDNNQE
jgi:hypothetical protein|tara:strand:+ start:613 stop:735 length:123 start_codon:yes stop_codon:yes gene_type:complete